MKKIINALHQFYMGFYYPVFVALLIFIGHSTGYDIAFGAVAILSMILACFICTDLRFAIPVFLYTIFIVTIDHSPNVPYYSRYYLQTPVLITVGTLAVLMIGAITYFAIRNRASANKPPKRGM